LPCLPCDLFAPACTARSLHPAERVQQPSLLMAACALYGRVATRRYQTVLFNNNQGAIYGAPTKNGFFFPLKTFVVTSTFFVRSFVVFSLFSPLSWFGRGVGVRVDSRAGSNNGFEPIVGDGEDWHRSPLTHPVPGG